MANNVATAFSREIEMRVGDIALHPVRCCVIAAVLIPLSAPPHTHYTSFSKSINILLQRTRVRCAWMMQTRSVDDLCS